jgi:glycosyltransferase involved in cell wall biosynthesis
MPDKNRQISVGALTLYPFDTIPGQRFRIEQWEPYLKERQISIDYLPFADKELLKTLPKQGHFLSKISGMLAGFARRIVNFKDLSNYDVIYIYRAAAMIGPAFLEKLMKFSNRPIIFDFDDAIFLTHTNEANKLFAWAKFAGKTGTICRLSDHVIVGNSWLGNYARQFNSEISIIPSSVDTDVYVPKSKKKRDDGKIVIGWTGSSTSQTHLEMFAPVLKKLFAKRSDIILSVHSDRSPKLEDIDFVWHSWTPETEVEIISSFDIGIMPLPDDEWSRGKCSMKALLYMSLAIPTVCSDVGMNREVIDQGKNGFLAGNEAEWIEYLEKLIDDENLRVESGKAARQTIVEKYSMKRCAELFADAIETTIAASAG